MAFSVVLALLVCVVLTAVSRMSVVNDHLHAITDENNVEAREAKDIRANSFTVGLLVRDIIITTDDATLKRQRTTLDEDLKALDGSVDKLDQLFNSLPSTTPTEKELMGKIKDMIPLYQASAIKVADLGAANKNTEATDTLRREFDPRDEALHPVVAQLANFEDKLNDDAASEAAHVYSSARMTMLLLGLLAAALAVVAACW